MNHRNNKDKQKFSMFYGIVETENNRTEILDFPDFYPHKRGFSCTILSKQKPSEQLPQLTGEPR